MCRPYSLKEFGSKILMIWFYPLNVHALRDTSPKLKDFIAYFFPKGFPQKEKYQIRKKSFSSFIGSKSSPLSTYSTKTNLKYDPNHARGHPYIYYAYYYYTTLWRRRKQGWKVSAEPSWGWRLQPTYNSSTSLCVASEALLVVVVVIGLRRSELSSTLFTRVTSTGFFP